METDEVIWVDVDDNSCTLDDASGKKVLKCNHYTGTPGNRTCSARKEGYMNPNPNELPCKNKPRILVNKQEYLTWKLTR